MNTMWFDAVWAQPWLRSSCCLDVLFYRSPVPLRVLSAARHRERERESRFRKLEACTLQVFELCHWRQHSHKVDGCPSPEVFPCQQACSALCRWIQTLSASQTGPFVWVFGKLFALPPNPTCQKNTTATASSLWSSAGSQLFLKKRESMIKQPALIKSHLIFTNKEKKNKKSMLLLIISLQWFTYFFFLPPKSTYLFQNCSSVAPWMPRDYFAVTRGGSRI